MSVPQRDLHHLIKYVPTLLPLNADRYLHFQSQVFNHNDETVGGSGIWAEENRPGILRTATAEFASDQVCTTLIAAQRKSIFMFSITGF